MPCGFCSKSIEGLKETTKPSEEKSSADMFFAHRSPADKIFQCQMCGEYWVSEVVLTWGPPTEGDTFPSIVSKTVNTPRGYNLANIDV